MIDDSNKGLFSYIIVYQLDRFARNKYESAINKQKLKKNGVKVVSARERISDDASGIILESVLEGMAEYYSVELGQKVTRGLTSNAENCYFNGGTVPLGYKTIEIDSIFRDNQGNPVKKKKLVINEETAPIVLKIFEMYLSDNVMADIVRYLNSQNIKTSRGNIFNKNSINRILNDIRYIGIYSYNGTEIVDGIPRIIDDETFNNVKEIMNKNKSAPARKRAKNEYLLTTKLFCGHCESSMVGISGTSKTTKRHHYYKCNGAIKKTCDKKPIRQDLIEDIVVKYARDILTDEYIQKIANQVVEITNKEKDTTNLKRLNKLLKENEQGTKNLFDSLKTCSYDNVRASIFEELSKMELERNQILNNIKIEESSHYKLSVTQVKYFLNQLKKGKINDIKYRKALIKTLIYKVYLYDDHALIVCNTQDKQEIRLKLEDIKSSFKDTNGSPI